MRTSIARVFVSFALSVTMTVASVPSCAFAEAADTLGTETESVTASAATDEPATQSDSPDATDQTEQQAVPYHEEPQGETDEYAKTMEEYAQEAQDAREVLDAQDDSADDDGDGEDSGDVGEALTAQSEPEGQPEPSAVQPMSSQTKCGITVNTSGETLWTYECGYRDPSKAKGTELPAGYQTNFQIKVSGNSEAPKFSINQYEDEDNAYAFEVSSTGLVTIGRHPEFYPYGVTCYVTVTVDNQVFDIPFSLDTYYQITADADAVAYKWYDENVSPSDTPLQKLQKITKKSASYVYDGGYNTYASLVLFGKGTCWSSAQFVKHLCDYAGIECYVRNGNRDPWGLSAHENDVAIIDGRYYIADGTPSSAGLVTSSSNDFASTGISSAALDSGGTTCKVTQYDGKESTLTIPSKLGGATVTEIDESAFSRNISFRNGIVRVVNIPATVTAIGEGAFKETSGLEAINVDAANPSFKSVDGVLYTKDGSELVAYPTAKKAASYEAISGTKVIRAHAFQGGGGVRSMLRTVTLPDGVTSIGDQAFYGSSIASIDLPSSLKTVGSEAFNGAGLSALVLPDSVETVGDDVFFGYLVVKGMATTISSLRYTKGICSFEDSAAETFASTNNLKYIVIGLQYRTLRSATPSQTSAQVERGSYVKLSLVKNPSNATADPVVYSDNPLVSTCYYDSSTGNLWINGIGYGSATVTAYVPGGATAEIAVTVPDPHDLSYATVSDVGTQALSSGGSRPTPKVTCSLGTLKVGRDCTLSYSNNTAAGTATVTITGIGSFSGVRTQTFAIVDAIPVYRLLYVSTNEHLYTTDANEVRTLCGSRGWTYEGAAWLAPKSGTPVYRLFQPSQGLHHYTADTWEINVITNERGWRLDFWGAPTFNSGGDNTIYRLFNRRSGQHLFTTDANEYAVLPGKGWGWVQEGAAMQCVALGDLNYPYPS